MCVNGLVATESAMTLEKAIPLRYGQIGQDAEPRWINYDFVLTGRERQLLLTDWSIRWDKINFKPQQQHQKCAWNARCFVRSIHIVNEMRDDIYALLHLYTTVRCKKGRTDVKKKHGLPFSCNIFRPRKVMSKQKCEHNRNKKNNDEFLSKKAMQTHQNNHIYK